MTVSDIISLSSSIGAFLAATATFLTVREMIRQRKASYRPELIVPSIVISGSSNSKIRGSVPDFWQMKDSPPTSEHEGYYLELPLRNIGLGAAKNISAQWSFPMSEFIVAINRQAEETDLNEKLGLNSKGFLHVNSERLGRKMSNWPSQQTDSRDYVLPAPSQTPTDTLRLPNAYQLAVSCALLFAVHADKPFPQIPSIVLKLEYFDVADEMYTIMYDIDFRVFAILGTCETFHARLEPKRRRG